LSVKTETAVAYFRAPEQDFLNFMSAKIKITKDNQPQWSQEYVFDQETIAIGRDDTNDLRLESTTSVVSRQHAQIKQHGDSYRIVDLNRRNFTFVNGEKLRPGVEYEVKDGDRIKICDIDLHFFVERSQGEPEAVPKPAEEFPNPFVEDVKGLAVRLDEICLKYDLEGHPGKETALHDAARQAVTEFRFHRAAELLAPLLSPPKETTFISEEKSGAAEATLSSFGRVQSLLDILLAFLIKLIQARGQFRLEFIGETMIKKVKSFSIYSCSEEELKSFLFDPAIPAQESQKRIEQIRGITDEIMLHQISMLDGYKAGISEGPKKLLERMDPSLLKKQLATMKWKLGPIKLSYRALPILYQKKLIRLFSDVHKELQQEDQAIIEKKYFRPAYIRNYYKRMDSLRTKESSAKKGSTEGKR
jgi:pSer/pThr/pTyr-binding forkhead associated (FHA) protein